MATKGKRLIFSGAMTLPATEAIALTATIKPGFSVTHTALGLTNNVSASTVFGYPNLFADYDILAAGNVDTALTINETMIARELCQGATANLVVATGNNITKRGVALTSNGAGKLKIAAVNGDDYILAYSDEIINVTSDALVRVKGA